MLNLSPQPLIRFALGSCLCASLSACNNDNPAQPTLPLPPAPVFIAQKHCLACHTADAEVRAPLWPSIADHYKGDKEAVNKLSEKIIKGGSGSFGSTKMPAQYKNITSDEAKYLVEWILKQK